MVKKCLTVSSPLINVGVLFRRKTSGKDRELDGRYLLSLPLLAELVPFELVLDASVALDIALHIGA